MNLERVGQPKPRELNARGCESGDPPNCILGNVVLHLCLEMFFVCTNGHKMEPRSWTDVQVNPAKQHELFK